MSALIYVSAFAADRPRLQFINGTDREFKIFWLPDGDLPVANGSVPANSSTTIDTTLGHRFEVRDEDIAVAEVTCLLPIQAYRYQGVGRKDPADMHPPFPNNQVIDVRPEVNVPDYYKKMIFADGYPIVGSAAVDDYALLEAAYLVNKLLGSRGDLRKAMIASGSRMCVMSEDEFTTDLPEFRWLASNSPEPGKTGKQYWDRRARGLGGSETDPYCSCGEENLLGFKGDPYAAESILIHEFAHNIHLRGMLNIDPTFDDRLERTYQAAMNAGLWKGKYAATNHHEYFAEGAQSWFDDNRENDHDHNHVNTRWELIEYDPGLAEMCREVFGDSEFRYTKPKTRITDHLQGYDPDQSPTFKFP